MHRAGCPPSCAAANESSMTAIDVRNPERPCAAKFNSTMPGVVWPAIPAPAGAVALALQYQFERTEWWSAETLRRHQFRQLDALLEFSFYNVPFYARRLADAGYRPGQDAAAQIWRHLPVLTRQDVQRLGAQLSPTSDPPGHGRRLSFRTSGSTGTPVAGVQTEQWRHYWEAITVRDNLWHRRDLTGRLGVIGFPQDGLTAGPDGIEAPMWNVGLGGAFANGPSILCDVNRPVVEQLAWLIKLQPDYLLTFPSVLRELLRETVGQPVPVPGLQAVVTLGEQLHDGLRERLRAQWGVPLQDIYSSVEIGYIALQCPTGTHYHVQSEACLVEILDEAGQACAPGQPGRVVVTPLHNFAMPLIRYAVGDYAEFGAPCACGRGLPVLSRIHGRVRNMLKRPDGSVVWPNIALPMVQSKLPIVQFQVVQRASDRLDVRLVTQRPLVGAEEDLLRRLICEACGAVFQIVFQFVESIPRHARGKYEDFYIDMSKPDAPGGAPPA